MTVFSLTVTFRLCGCGRRQIWISFLSKSDKMIPIYIVSVSVTFGAYYITDRWGEFIKKCHLMLAYTFLALLFTINFVFLSFSFLFRMKYHVSATEY